MSIDIGDQGYETGYYPAYEQLEGPPGEAGADIPGPAGPAGPVGGSPLWERSYDVFNVNTVTLPPSTGHREDFGTGYKPTYGANSRVLTIPTPGPAPTPPAGVEDPVDPSYAGDQAWADYHAAYDLWLSHEALNHFTDVEVGLWMEANPGSTGFNAIVLEQVIYAGAGNPIETRWVPLYGKDNAITIEPGYPFGSAAVNDDGTVNEARMAWFTDDGGEKHIAGLMRRRASGQPCGWAGPVSDAIGTAPTRMRDIFRFGPSDEVVTSQWRIIVPDNCTVHALRLKLKLYSRRLTSYVAPHPYLQAQTYPVTGHLEAVRIPGNADSNPVTIVAGQAKTLNMESLSFQGLDPNNFGPDPGDGSGYGWKLDFARPVMGFIRADASWSRYVPRSSNLIDSHADIGRSLTLQLHVDTEDGELVYESVINITQRQTPLEHHIGPVWVRGAKSAWLVAVNQTTQSRDFVGTRDAANGLQQEAPWPGYRADVYGEDGLYPANVNGFGAGWGNVPPTIGFEEIPGLVYLPSLSSGQGANDDAEANPNLNLEVLPYLGEQAENIDRSPQTTSPVPGIQGPAGKDGRDGTMLSFAGAYSGLVTYDAQMVVTSGGSSYLSLYDDNLGNPVTDTTWWQLLAAAGAKGDTGLQGETGAAGSPLPGRQTVQVVTASLVVGAAQTGVVALAKGFRVLKVATDKPAWVRLYTSPTKRDGDAARLVNVDPTGDHGVILEVITKAGQLSYELVSPTPSGFSGENPPSANIAYRISNVDSSAGPVTVTFTYQQQES